MRNGAILAEHFSSYSETFAQLVSLKSDSSCFKNQDHQIIL